jgi:hypothetical protein
VTSSGPIQWIAKPREVNDKLDAEAYVVSAVLQSGEEITFETPKFGVK